MPQPIYLNEDSAICVCQGKGEYWAIGERGQSIILNVFTPYRRSDGTLVPPDFDGLVEVLLPCRYHGTAREMTEADDAMLTELGIAAASDRTLQ